MKWAPVDEATVQVDDLERSMRGQVASLRCPFCRNVCTVQSTKHPYGETWVEEVHYIECPLCDVVIPCRECFGYTVLHPETHPFLTDLDQKHWCRCPKPEPEEETCPSKSPTTSPTSSASTSASRPRG